jgi:hypothetical protein
MPKFAEADLLPKFTALTGMHPDCPIPGYLRMDADLFFTNFFAFRGDWSSLVGSASSVAPTVAAGSASSVAQTPTVELASNPSSQLVSPPQEFMKVFMGIETESQQIE